MKRTSQQPKHQTKRRRDQQWPAITAAVRAKPKKSDVERAFDAMDAMLLCLEKDLWKRAKAAAKRGWFAQALADDNGAKTARAIYTTDMYHLRLKFGVRR